MLRGLNELKLLKKMQAAVSEKEKERNKKHQVFEPSIHKNPVSGKWKLVEHYLDYLQSSARYYDLGEKSICRINNFVDVSSAESPQ